VAFIETGRKFSVLQVDDSEGLITDDQRRAQNGTELKSAYTLLVAKDCRLLRVVNQEHPSFLNCHPSDGGANLPLPLRQGFVAEIARCSGAKSAFFPSDDASAVSSQRLDRHVENVSE
jgi:hypothetical protein